MIVSSWGNDNVWNINLTRTDIYKFLINYYTEIVIHSFGLGLSQRLWWTTSLPRSFFFKLNWGLRPMVLFYRGPGPTVLFYRGPDPTFQKKVGMPTSIYSIVITCARAGLAVSQPLSYHYKYSANVATGAIELSDQRSGMLIQWKKSKYILHLQGLRCPNHLATSTSTAPMWPQELLSCLTNALVCNS